MAIFKSSDFSALFFEEKPIPTGTDNVFTFHIALDPKKMDIDMLIRIVKNYIKENKLGNNIKVEHRTFSNYTGFIIKFSKSTQQEAKQLIDAITENVIRPNVISLENEEKLEQQKNTPFMG